MADTPVVNIYDKSGCARYKILVQIVFYPLGIRNFIFRNIPIKDKDRILDAGCGYGILSKAIHDKVKGEGLAGIEQHAFDISNDMLEAFKGTCRGADIHLRKLDVRDLSYDDNYFDLTVTSAMLEYVPNLEEALISLKRCLRREGRIYVFMSRKSLLNDLLFRPWGNPKCHSFSELKALFLKMGFHNVMRHRFPRRFFWLNVWGVIIEGTK